MGGWALKRRRWLIIGALVVVFTLWIASGIYVVQAGEEGVVQTFGAFTGVTTPGLNYHLPAPFQNATIVNVESIRRAEIGFRSEGQRDREDVLSEALMLTADENIVQVELLVQYRVADSADYLFNVQDPVDVLRTSAEVGLRGTVGQMTIDDVITEQRARVQDNTRVFLAQMMEDYGTGIQITDVRLQVADPPEEVRDAFQEVVRALADKERLINVAQAYQNDIVPRARGDKQRLIEEASAFADQRILLAEGDAQRFLAVLKAYQTAPDITRERMHIEALEGILDDVSLILLDAEAVGGEVLPFLPLDSLNGAGSTTENTPAQQPSLRSLSVETAPTQEQSAEQVEEGN
jgi:membrane protease subunit HflK